MANYVFPKVELPNVGRSNFNLSKSVFMSFAPSTIRVPYCKDVLPKDHFEIDLNASIESMPMLSPMYGRWKARWAFYFEPYSNIYGWMDNNTRKSTESIIKSELFKYVLPLGFIDKSVSDSDIPVELYSFKSVYFNDLHYEFSYPEWLKRAKVASSSIWNDLGWPIGWSGYVEQVYTTDPSSYNIVALDSDLNRPTAGYDDLIVDRAIGRLTEVPGSVDVAPQSLHAVKALGYLDIIRNYYVNNQENRIPYIGYTDGVESFTNRVDWVTLEVLDYILMFFRSIKLENLSIPRNMSLSTYLGDYDPLSGYESVHEEAYKFLESWERSYFIPNGGTFLTPYSMDLNRGLMNAQQGNFQSYLQTDVNGRISVSQLYSANKIQELINILDITGGRFSDWVNALWNVDIRGDIDKPIYLGSHTEFISTHDIISPSNTDGSLAGQQTGFSAGYTRKFKRVSFNSDQYGVIYCVFSMVPEVRYSTGFAREDLKNKFSDIYNPRQSQLGYQDVPANVLNCLGSNTTGFDIQYAVRKSDGYGGFTSLSAYGALYNWYIGLSDYDYIKVNEFPVPFEPYTVVGRQVAWAEYMADIDESRGLFALDQDLSYWTMNRSYTLPVDNSILYSGQVGGDSSTQLAVGRLRRVENTPSYTTYVLPSEWNLLFADSSPDAENFRMYLNFSIFAKRAIPSRTLPHI